MLGGGSGLFQGQERFVLGSGAVWAQGQEGYGKAAWDRGTMHLQVWVHRCCRSYGADAYFVSRARTRFHCYRWEALEPALYVPWCAAVRDCNNCYGTPTVDPPPLWTPSPWATACRHGSELPLEIERLWSTLAGNRRNIIPVLDFLVSLGMHVAFQVGGLRRPWVSAGVSAGASQLWSGLFDYQVWFEDAHTYMCICVCICVFVCARMRMCTNCYSFL